MTLENPHFEADFVTLMSPIALNNPITLPLVLLGRWKKRLNTYTITWTYTVQAPRENRETVLN